MKILRVQLAGGIGNQLFQLAAGLYFSNRVKKKLALVMPERGDSKYFHEGGLWTTSQISLQRRARFLRSGMGGFIWRLERMLVHKSKGFGRLRGIFESVSNNYPENLPPRTRELRGYFQSAKIAQSSRTEIQKIFFNQLKFVPTAINQRYEPKVSIALHIRRGDYKSLDHIYGTLGKEYYLEGLRKCFYATGFKQVLVFSDDLGEAKKFLQDLKFATYNFSFVDTNYTPLDSIFLMSKCSAHVIANSTFSWWGAFLSDSSEIVVAPEPWTKVNLVGRDFYPDSWIKLPSNWN